MIEGTLRLSEETIAALLRIGGEEFTYRMRQDHTSELRDRDWNQLGESSFLTLRYFPPFLDETFALADETATISIQTNWRTRWVSFQGEKAHLFLKPAFGSRVWELGNLCFEASPHRSGFWLRAPDRTQALLVGFVAFYFWASVGRANYVGSETTPFLFEPRLPEWCTADHNGN